MTVEEIEKLVATLPESDFRRFSAWFEAYRAEQWDNQIANDAAAGRLDHLIRQAREDYGAGRTKPLPGQAT